MNRQIITFLTLFALIFSLGSQPAQAKVEPQEVWATSGPIDVFVGVLQYDLTFWNVGSDGGSQYGEVVVDIKCIEATGDWECSEEVQGPVYGTFSGGPNGHFLVEGVAFDLVDGQRTTIYDGGTEFVFTVQNPQAFADWDTDAADEDEYITLPTTEGDRSELEPGDMLDFSYPKITKVMGEVQISDANKRSSILSSIYRSWQGDPEPWRVWEEGAKDQQMNKNSIIKTGLGRAIIEFKDGSKLVLDKGSTISFTDAGFGIDNGSCSFTYKKYGSKFILTGKKVKFGILGTEVSWEVDGDDVIFKVIEGKVEAEAIDSGETVILTAGEKVELDYNNDLLVRDFDVEAEIDKWEVVEADAMATGESGTPAAAGEWGWLAIVLVLAVIVGVLLMAVVIIFIAMKTFGRKKPVEVPVTGDTMSGPKESVNPESNSPPTTTPIDSPDNKPE